MHKINQDKAQMLTGTVQNYGSLTLRFWELLLGKKLGSSYSHCLRCMLLCNWQLLKRRSVLGVHWRDWCWSWNSNTLATWCRELTHLKRPWCWERLRAGGVGDDRGWDGWMASPTQRTWVWVDSRRWWWTWRPGVLRFMGSQRVRHDWSTELNWNILNTSFTFYLSFIKAKILFGFPSISKPRCYSGLL